MSQIQFVRRATLDEGRWNRCIETSPNGLIYSTTNYLDLLAGSWDALVYNNYECIMPLTGKVKYGAHYLYQPAFCQQLGITGVCNECLEMAFINKAKDHYPFAEINMNFSNSVTGTNCNNYVLDLNLPYEHLASGYSNDLKKNLHRASHLQLHYLTSENAEYGVGLFKELYGKRFPHVNRLHYTALVNYCRLHKNHFLVREVRQGDKLLSTVVCLTYKNRIYFMASSTLPEGRDLEANHFLVDQLIREFSNQEKLLDFEGSDLPGVAAFYKNFGPVNQPYMKVAWNHLKLPWRWFK
jgi:hypothetical protein